MNLLLKVCLAFLKIGAFSFGGGYAVLAMIQQEVVEGNGWIDPADFVNIVAIAEMTPGPIAVNSSTFVGYDLFGVFGGVICSLCAVAVPFCLSLLVAIYFTKFKDNPYLKKALNGIRPAVIGVIAASCLSVAKVSITGLDSLIFFGAALYMVWRKKISPILTLITCGVLGAVFYSVILPLLGA